jgi:hypothetical protein
MTVNQLGDVTRQTIIAELECVQELVEGDWALD